MTAYEKLEADKWKGMKSPHFLRGCDCFRRGNERAFVAAMRWPLDDWQAESYSYAFSAIPRTDLFNRREWKPTCLIATDDGSPQGLIDYLTRS